MPKRFALSSILCSALALAVMSGLPECASAERQLVDGIVAQVGTKVVLFSEVLQLTAPSEQKMLESGAPPEEILRFRADVLERLIDRRLIENVIELSNMEATDIEVDGAIENIAAENGLSVETLKSSVESEGLSFSAYREEIRGEIERARVINSRVRSRVRVDEEAARALYEIRYRSQSGTGDEVRLEQILVTESAERDAETTCTLIEQAREQALAGRPLAEVADDDPAYRFSELDWIHADQLAEWMVSTVEGTSPGEYAAPLQTAFGCVLIHLIERRGFEPTSFDEVKPELYDELYNKQLETEYAKWLEEMRQETYIARKGVFAQSEEPEDGLPSFPRSGPEFVPSE